MQRSGRRRVSQSRLACSAECRPRHTCEWSVMPRLLPQGIGKRVTVDQFRLQKRGGVGLKSIRLNDGDTLAAINTVTHSRPQRFCTASLTLVAHTQRSVKESEHQTSSLSDCLLLWH